MEEESLFAFLDILGTKDLIKSGKFGDLHALDFVNPVGLAAQYIPDVRFAAFSDCVMISAPKEKHKDFISAISFCYSQWCSDHIFVRGGLSLGEIFWVDDSATDNWFGKLKNFAYARIYGKALVSAYKLEVSSGPGNICFLDESASNFLSSCSNHYVLKSGQTDMLIWCSKNDSEYWYKTFQLVHDLSEPGSEKRKQMYATMKYFTALDANKTYLPDNFGLISQFRSPDKMNK